jgi:succinate dehydrogenase/fumarate reductase flavoprotein subunit
MGRGLRKMTRKQTGRTSNTETFETEIVVIGVGGGLAAGVAASGEGAKVMLLEKLKKTGGNIVMATGFLAAESPV